MTEKNKEEEPEVITAKEFLEQHKNMKEEEVNKFVLVCKNCNHKDLLKNFLRKKDLTRRVDVVPGDFEPKPYKPNPWNVPYKPKIPYKDPYKRYRCNKTTNSKTAKMMALMINNENYEDMFYCPKCGSSLVVLCKEFVKNNIVRAMEDEK